MAELTMFPADPGVVPAQSAGEIGRVPAFSTEDARFLLVDGALKERSGREAVQQWFDLALRQQPGRVLIYPKDQERTYGVARDLIGSKYPSGLILAELERNVRDTASYCPAVRSIQNFSAQRSGRGCTVSFTAVLHTNETVEVMADV